jgi:hypothetical protein
MKVTSANLEAVQGLLSKASELLANQTKAAKSAEEQRQTLDGRVRGLQGAFDICAASFAQGTELSTNQLNDLPTEAQAALGYKKPASDQAPVPTLSGNQGAIAKESST